MAKYYCSANELYFCRTFMSFTGEGELRETLSELSKGGLKRTLLLFLSAFPVVILHGTILHLPSIPFQTYIGVGLALVFVALIISAFLNIGRANNEYRNFEDSFMNRPESLNEQVMIYDLTYEGIYLNIFNKIDEYDMIFIAWENVEKCEVDYLSYPNVFGSEKNVLRRRMLKDFKEIQRVHKDFRYSTSLTHRDKTGIKLYLKGGGFDYLPLPQLWKDSGDERRFIVELTNYIHVEKVKHEEIQLLDLFKGKQKSVRN